MKNKVISILVLVSIIVSLLGVTIPATLIEAESGWLEVNTPRVTVGTNANVFDIASDGQTMYLYDNTYLYKSIDAGISWSKTGLTLPASGAITQMKISQSSSLYLIATDGVGIYKSTSGGIKWIDITPYGMTAVKSIDISTNAYDEPVYLATDGTNVFLYDNGYWLDTTDEIGNGWGSCSAIAAAFSPNYAYDSVITAVAYSADVNDADFDSNTTENVAMVRGLLVDTVDLLTSWGSDFHDEVLTYHSEAINANSGTTATIDLPSDFNSSNSTCKIFVGLSGSSRDGIFRVNSQIILNNVVCLGVDISPSSLDYKGTASTGVLAVSQYDSPEVLTTETADTSTGEISAGDWIFSSIVYSGDSTYSNTVVKFSPDTGYLYAGTNGNNSGLFISTDYTSFEGIAFINVSDFANISLSNLKTIGDKWFVILTDAATPTYRLFASSDNGTTWKMIYVGDTDFNIYTSPDNAIDQTIYLIPTYASKEYKESTDNGATWRTKYAPAAINAFAPVDGNTYWFGNSNGIRLNIAGSDYASINFETPEKIMVYPNFIVVSTVEGSIYLSTDNASNFALLGYSGQFLNTGVSNAPLSPIFTISEPANTIYAIEPSSQNLLKWMIGTSSAWDIALNFSELPTDLSAVGISSIQYLSNGDWYITSIGNTVGQIWHSQDLIGTKFTAIEGTDPTSFGGNLSGENLTITINSDNAAVIYPIIYADSSPIDTYRYKLLSYTVTNPPTITGISPNQGSKGKTYDVSISGTNLNGATQSSVSFGPGITVNSLTSVSAGKITANITIDKKAVSGQRDVSITTPGGTATLTAGFTVGKSTKK